MADITIKSRNIILRNTPHIAQATGNVANFGTDMGSELKECKINLLPRQEGTGDPSPTNVRTLNGWADLQVYQFGENAIGTVEPYYSNVPVGGALWKRFSDGTIEYTGKPTAFSGMDVGYIDITNMDQIYGKIIGDDGNMAFDTLALYDSNNNRIGNGSVSWETFTNFDRFAFSDFADFPTAIKARITCKRYVNNINMRGRCCAIIGSSEEDIKYNKTTITFPAAGKNLFNLHVPEISMYPRSGSATTKRLFTPNTIVNQTSGTNYFNTTYMPYSVNGNTLTINCKSGYGTGFAFRLKPSTTYTINADFDVDTGAGIGISYYSADGTFYKQVEGAALIYLPLSFTTRADTDIVLLTFKAVAAELYNTDIHITNIQLEEGSTGTEYEEYQYPIWGGYVDLVNNEWVETWGHIHLTSENMQGIRTVSSDKSNFVYTYAINDAKTLSENEYEYANSIVSDKIKAESISTAYPDEFEGYMNDARRFCFGIPSELSTIEQVKTWVDSIGGIDLCYQLATPIHHSLVIPNFSTLHGINNIWSNGNGGINLSYYKHDDESYQYVPANAMVTNNDYIIVTSDGYVIGDENDYITY